MTQQSKTQGPSQKAGPSRPSQSDDVRTQKQKAEAKEVAGRHKNDGQKDNKGAR